MDQHPGGEHEDDNDFRFSPLDAPFSPYSYGHNSVSDTSTYVMSPGHDSEHATGEEATPPPSFHNSAASGDAPSSTASASRSSYSDAEHQPVESQSYRLAKQTSVEMMEEFFDILDYEAPDGSMPFSEGSTNPYQALPVTDPSFVPPPDPNAHLLNPASYAAASHAESAGRELERWTGVDVDDSILAQTAPVVFLHDGVHDTPHGTFAMGRGKPEDGLYSEEKSAGGLQFLDPVGARQHHSQESGYFDELFFDDSEHAVPIKTEQGHQEERILFDVRHERTDRVAELPESRQSFETLSDPFGGALIPIESLGTGSNRSLDLAILHGQGGSGRGLLGGPLAAVPQQLGLLDQDLSEPPVRRKRFEPDDPTSAFDGERQDPSRNASVPSQVPGEARTNESRALHAPPSQRAVGEDGHICTILTTFHSKYWRNDRKNLQCFPSCPEFGDYYFLRARNLKHSSSGGATCSTPVRAVIQGSGLSAMRDIIALSRINLVSDSGVCTTLKAGGKLSAEEFNALRKHCLAGKTELRDQQSVDITFSVNCWKLNLELSKKRRPKSVPDKAPKYCFEVIALVKGTDGTYRVLVNTLSRQFHIASTRTLTREIESGCLETKTDAALTTTAPDSPVTTSSQISYRSRRKRDVKQELDSETVAAPLGQSHPAKRHRIDQVDPQFRVANSNRVCIEVLGGEASSAKVPDGGCKPSGSGDGVSPMATVDHSGDDDADETLQCRAEAQSCALPSSVDQVLAAEQREEEKIMKLEQGDARPLSRQEQNGITPQGSVQCNRAPPSPEPELVPAPAPQDSYQPVVARPRDQSARHVEHSATAGAILSARLQGSVNHQGAIEAIIVSDEFPVALDVYQVSTAYRYCFLLGIFGGHHFYLGRNGWGLVYLCTFGLCFVGWLYDLFRLRTLVDRVNRQSTISCTLEEAYMVWLVLGLFGGHRYAIGDIKWGLYYTCTLGGLGFGFLADACRLPSLYQDSMLRGCDHPYSLTDAFILWFPGGLIGLHHLYLGNIKRFWLYLLTFGLLGFGWIADAVALPDMVARKIAEEQLSSDASNQNHAGNVDGPRSEAPEIELQPRQPVLSAAL